MEHRFSATSKAECDKLNAMVEELGKDKYQGKLTQNVYGTYYRGDRVVGFLSFDPNTKEWILDVCE